MAQKLKIERYVIAENTALQAKEEKNRLFWSGKTRKMCTIENLFLSTDMYTVKSLAKSAINMACLVDVDIRKLTITIEI